MKRGWLIAAVLAFAACAQDPATEPVAPEPSGAPSSVVGSTATPTAPASTPTTTETQAPGASTVQVFLFREHESGNWVEPQTVALDEPTVAVAHAAMQALTTASSTDPALDNLIPQGTQVLGVDLDGDTLVVDFDFPQDGIPLGAAYEAAAYDQIVHTGTQFPTVSNVQVLDEGRTPTSGHLDLAEPLARDEFDVVPVDIVEPEYGATVDAGDVTVSGTANTFEATVELRLVNPAGEAVEQTFTTATCGSGCRGDWEHTFSGVDESGAWTVVAAEPDPSDGEGRAPFVVETRFNVAD